MHKNSILAYKDILETIPPSKAQVMRVIRKRKKITRQDIAEALGWQINSVTGRVKELLDLGYIYESGTKIVNKRPRALLSVSESIT